MSLNRLDETLRSPLYHQIYLILREKIINGEYPADSLLPGEQDAAEIFSVSRITVKRALDELAAEGFCVRERGRGTRVTYQPSAPLQAGVEGLMENLLSMGLNTDVELLEFGYIDASHEVTAALGLSAGERVQQSRRVRKLDGKPFSYLTAYVPAGIGKTYDEQDIASTPLLMLLERNGIRVTRAKQIIAATAADAAVSRALGVELGTALLQINRIVYDQDNSAVEYIRAQYRTDRYQYRMSLTRTGEDHARSWSAAE